MSRSNEWVSRTLGYLSDWRAEAARSYKHKIGTIIVFGNCMESIDAPSIRIEREPDNDNRRIA